MCVIHITFLTQSIFINSLDKGPPKTRGPFYLIMKKIVTEMQEHNSAWPFLVPVSGVPDYYTVIKEPMGETCP